MNEKKRLHHQMNMDAARDVTDAERVEAAIDRIGDARDHLELENRGMAREDLNAARDALTGLLVEWAEERRNDTGGDDVDGGSA
jgi:hypothetical protein